MVLKLYLYFDTFEILSMTHNENMISKMEDNKHREVGTSNIVVMKFPDM